MPEVEEEEVVDEPKVEVKAKTAKKAAPAKGAKTTGKTFHNKNRKV